MTSITNRCKKCAKNCAPFAIVRAIPSRSLRCPFASRSTASYANFLMLQNRILLPTFGSERDKEAQRILQQHTGREVVPIDCRVLLRQHGGLHCMSMQFVRGAIALHNLKRF